MFEKLSQQPPDALLALIKLYAADPNPDKIDLGVGVYRDAAGGTPVFRAIKQAEARLVETQDSKSYLGPEGDMGFVNALIPHVFSGIDVENKVVGMQGPGGTGAVRLAADLLKRAGVPRILLGVPSWPNHKQIFDAVGIETQTFVHADIKTQAIDFDAVMAAIEGAQPGDAILLHGCCHNPTGIDYARDQWQAIAAAVVAKRLLPLMDLAYQGLGDGFDEDAEGLRIMLAAVPEALIAYSCDKNFGLYRDRVGALYLYGQDATALTAAMSNAHALARANWSMPPDHGAAAVRIILEDAQLTQMWLAEVDEMRARMRDVRAALAAKGAAGPIDLKPLGSQHGLFSTLPLSPEQILAIRGEHSVYMAGSGRINIAGLTLPSVDRLVAAIEAVTVGVAA